jgi:hypothetical protein
MGHAIQQKANVLSLLVTSTPHAISNGVRIRCRTPELKFGPQSWSMAHHPQYPAQQGFRAQRNLYPFQFQAQVQLFPTHAAGVAGVALL